MNTATLTGSPVHFGKISKGRKVQAFLFATLVSPLFITPMLDKPLPARPTADRLNKFANSIQLDPEPLNDAKLLKDFKGVLERLTDNLEASACTPRQTACLQALRESIPPMLANANDPDQHILLRSLIEQAQEVFVDSSEPSHSLNTIDQLRVFTSLWLADAKRYVKNPQTIPLAERAANQFFAQSSQEETRLNETHISNINRNIFSTISVWLGGLLVALKLAGLLPKRNNGSPQASESVKPEATFFPTKK